MLNTTGNIMLNKMCHRYPIVNIFSFHYNYQRCSRGQTRSLVVAIHNFKNYLEGIFMILKYPYVVDQFINYQK